MRAQQIACTMHHVMCFVATVVALCAINSAAVGQEVCGDNQTCADGFCAGGGCLGCPTSCYHCLKNCAYCEKVFGSPSECKSVCPECYLQYACVNDTCIEAKSVGLPGVHAAQCEALCKPATYACHGGQCVEEDKGVNKTTCERFCK